MKIDKLKQSARASAFWRGHRLTSFKSYGSTTTATAVCEDCGMDVTVDVHPAPNGIDIGGPAVALNCPSAGC